MIGDAEDMEAADSTVVRTAWFAVEQVGRIVGPERVRWLAAVVWGRSASTEEGFLKLAMRVSSRLRTTNPRLFKVPATWVECSPVVRARRLGLDWELDLRDNLQALLFFAGTYEPALVRLLNRELQRGDVFVDVGSHVGVHALTVARRLQDLRGGRVLAFEPTTDSAEKLDAAARRNRLVIEVVRTALGERIGSTALFSDPVYGRADAGVRSQFNTGPLVEEVPLTTFDAWASSTGLDRLDLVKVDVEGAEIAVMQGMQQSLRLLRPRLLVIEAKEHGFVRSGTSPHELRNLLATCGYISTGEVLHHNEVFRPVR